MRHRNTISTSCVSFRQGRIVDTPYQSQYINSYNCTKFANASSKKTYVKVLQYIADHDGCKRVDVNINILGWKRNMAPAIDEKNQIKRIAYWSRGQHSNMYAQLLYIDVINYDKHFCYHITDKGREVLKKAYLNDMAKFVKGK